MIINLILIHSKGNFHCTGSATRSQGLKRAWETKLGECLASVSQSSAQVGEWMIGASMQIWYFKNCEMLIRESQMNTDVANLRGQQGATINAGIHIW